MSTSSDKPEYVLWPYTPTIAAGAICAVIMGILFSIHTYRLIINRTWFCIPFVVGALCETIGYAARAAAHTNTLAKTPYIIQSTLLLLAPILFAASIYMILGRLMSRTESTSLSLIRASWVTKIFVGGDILCFFVQAGGAGILVSADDSAGFKRGENVILGGLMLQILIFAFFVLVAGVWHARLNRVPTAAASELPAWGRYMWFLYGASLCITIRNVCRVVEYALGKDGYLRTHEWPIHVYDFLPMMVTLMLCVAWYDPNIKPKGKRDIEFEARAR
ncbi:RTA1 like protein [Plenodomus tracheiphilus IPT5]|uniref:RTA1 like protein n=1 Tax=Plenodomus tracheiphilus IPT5 TaxID=1408161 RepID=A0A6A7B465_9PLEO|nr:RTA1 like protein [Plenodomus tracheiphilus IPT5]